MSVADVTSAGEHYVRSGADSDRAVKAAMISIGKVITASATTVGLTFLLLSFAKMGVFRTVGISAAIGIAIAYLAGVTLLPAILALAGPRGWVKPRRELTASARMVPESIALRNSLYPEMPICALPSVRARTASAPLLVAR